MLSEEGYRARFWRGYPHLRRVLERPDDHRPSGADLSEMFGDGDRANRVSTDHGPLGRLADLVALTRLVASRAADIDSSISAGGPNRHGVIREMGELLDELQFSVYHLKRSIDEVFDREIESARAVAMDLEMKSAMRWIDEDQKRNGPNGA